MKTGTSLGSKAVKASEQCNLKTGSIGVRNSPKKTNKLKHKARGCGQEMFTDNENQHFPFKELMKMCSALPNRENFLTQKTEAKELHTGQMLTSAKIKLQLFPINDGTRIGLEKDGLYPYLELTLSGRKKISSVLEHLGKKWGSSSIAKGELILFPYNIMENQSDRRRWTINDSDKTASTVYAALGSPAIFRLRYGWFLMQEPRSFGIPPTPVPYEAAVLGGGSGNLGETLYSERDKVEVSKEYEATDVGNEASETVAQRTGRSLGSKAVKASEQCNLKTGSIGVRNSPKKTNKLDHKARGCGQEMFTDNENQHFPFKELMKMCSALPNRENFLTQKTEAKELHTGQMLTSAKIKLQLFPINDGTRIGLAKDGLYPYLELTLSGQKKISSVLEHLGKKWGSSSIAKGELILFPYNIMQNQSDHRRWTINDSDTTASTVYAALGSPAIFRLRYGWFLMQEPRSFGIPPTPVPYEAAVLGGGSGNLGETLYSERDKVEVSKEYEAIDVGNEASETIAQKIDNVSVDPMDNEPKLSSSLQQSSPWIDILSNISIGGLLSEASLQGRVDPKLFAGIQPCEVTTDSLDAFIAAQINQHPVSRLSAQDLGTCILDAEETCHVFPLQKLSSPTDMQIACGKNYSVVCDQDVSSNLKLSNTDQDNEPKLSSSLQQSSPWIDILSNISIGGLLSEASLQSRVDPKSFAGIQPCEITTDSLDAFIAAQINQRPDSKLFAQDLCTSILDAEETCHAFPLQKLSSPRDVQIACGKDYSVVCGQDVSSNLKLSNTDKVNDQDGPSQNPPSGKTRTETELLFSSCPYDDERSLGLKGINWNDSMGPFDFGMPAQKLIGGYVK